MVELEQKPLKLFGAINWKKQEQRDILLVVVFKKKLERNSKKQINFFKRMFYF